MMIRAGYHPNRRRTIMSEDYNAIETWRRRADEAIEGLTETQLHQVAELCLSWHLAGNRRKSDQPYGLWHAASMVCGTKCCCYKCRWPNK